MILNLIFDQIIPERTIVSRVKLWNNFKKKIIIIIKKKSITIIKLIPIILIKFKKQNIKIVKPNLIIILIEILKRIRKLVPRFLTLFSITKIVLLFI